jgi:hypothetical protein
MGEHPILFSDEMVRAILDGRKTQVRVPLRKQPLDILPMNEPNKWIVLMSREPNHGLLVDCRYGIPGDQLWVREAWSIDPNDYMPDTDAEWTRQHVGYRADDPEAKPTHWGWQPSVRMPRWASRITLTITDVRVERVTDITEDDAIAEGVEHGFYDGGYWTLTDDPRCDYRRGFIRAWDSTYAKRGYGWDTNPWVWRIEFRKDGLTL